MNLRQRLQEARERREQLRAIPPSQIRRRFDYDRRRLVNGYLATLEEGSHTLEEAVVRTGLSPGYPSWNLLYYALFCSLPPSAVVVVETGTNIGTSTIVLAQALKDAGLQAVVRTVDIDPALVEAARENVCRAGLTDYVEFAACDSLEFLAGLAAQVDHIDFAYLDGDHSTEHVLREFELVGPLVEACGGKVYFDNTRGSGVAEALVHICERHGGSIVDFANCSWGPPGNAIWQPDRRLGEREAQ